MTHNHDSHGVIFTVAGGENDPMFSRLAEQKFSVRDNIFAGGKGLFHIKYRVVMCMHPENGKHRKVTAFPSVPTDEDDPMSMRRGIFLVKKSVKCAEHLAVFHMMAVNQGIRVGKVGGISAVEKNAARQ